MSVTLGVREVSVVESVTRKRMYARFGDASFPSAGTGAHSLQLSRSSLVEVSRPLTEVTPEVYSLVTETLPVPERLQTAAAV